MNADALTLHLLQFKLYNHLKTVTGYRAALRGAVRGLWNGTFSYDQFIDAFDSAIRFHFPRAWGEGLAAVGLTMEDMNLEEKLKLQTLIVQEQSYIDPFAQAIEAGSKANRGPLQPLLDRVERWLARYNGIKSLAMQLAKNDPKLMWVKHASDSCDSCRRLDGKVKRASVWRAADLRPQSMRLACMQSAKGVPVCKCELVPTDAPISPGRLPAV